jgi:hypothetical protein
MPVAGNGDGPMRQQQATTIVPLPLATVEKRLRDVESWSEFLEGVASIRYTSHERYVFTLADGRDRREIKMVVKLRYQDHCFVWHGIAGPTVRGSLKLSPVDDKHTSVTLVVASLPTDLRSGMVEMMMPNSSTAMCDVQLLERHLLKHTDTEPDSELRSAPSGG